MMTPSGRPSEPPACLADLIATGMNQSIILTDANGLVTWANPAFTALSGYSLEEVNGRKPGDLMQCPETDRKTIAELSLAIRSGKPISRTILNRSKKGRYYWLEMEIRPILTDADEIEGFLSLQVDVTERINTHNRQRAIFESAIAGIVIHDEAGDVIDANPEALSLLGLTRD
ncbi:MAG: PAS domain S-box protein, partial [Rubellimicrobium sp.]|nr:PAS domain S-box protein [Rubellimicrobium sp.]